MLFVTQTEKHCATDASTGRCHPKGAPHLLELKPKFWIQHEVIPKPMTDPWDWYIYLHEWLIFKVNVGTYTIPYMDPMGIPSRIISPLDGEM